ncbi:hypothetical protein V6N12_013466 [Hibiscus sabdariffa]|uniref:Uncharacterized protein n=1 Tax=Hibiscus sabdariffa TaxID=183260 RepID=A0ABR2BI80_9ROSI
MLVGLGSRGRARVERWWTTDPVGWTSLVSATPVLPGQRRANRPRRHCSSRQASPFLLRMTSSSVNRGHRREAPPPLSPNVDLEPQKGVSNSRIGIGPEAMEGRISAVHRRITSVLGSVVMVDREDDEE